MIDKIQWPIAIYNSSSYPRKFSEPSSYFLELPTQSHSLLDLALVFLRYPRILGGLTTIKIVASQHTSANLPNLPEVVRERPQNLSNLSKKAYLEPLLM
jgi:hypothetical protein